MRLSTPVVLMIFNRPDTTEKVFREIAKAKPAKLLVVADGPRQDRAGEVEKCSAARAIIEEIDWDCEVIKNYSDVNLGCKYRVSSGIDWVFEKVGEAIILEDDCLPSQSFFPFCQELLDRYKTDTRVMQICGSNYLGECKTDNSYYFSKYGPIWGWATWKRAWKYYDVDMKLWPMVKQKKLHYDFCFDADEIRARENIFDSIYDGAIDTWDYQWVFAKLVNNGLSITPEKNLISNIGFSKDATHTKDKGDKREKLTRNELEFPLLHPAFMVRNYELDHKYFVSFIKQNVPKNGVFLNIVKKLLRRN
jgi:hypothetical protein